jgi:hypothetical protein
MKRILLSIGSILFAGAILAGGTGALLSSGNSSTGNTFATGVIQLLVDNESYATDNWGNLYFSSSTSWALSSLEGKLFFNFLDLKPGDIGEDTISLHVNNNNAWSCMNVKITGTPENGQNEPELLLDTTTGVNQGELQNHMFFSFWADDGDNVYETGETIFKEGLAGDIFDGKNWTIADSQSNIWGPAGPLIGGSTYYIGKAWCFGEMAKTPRAQDGLGKTGANGPLSRGTGFSCRGNNVGNAVQSDGIVADVNFSVAQSRNNNSYLCSGTPPQKGKLIVQKTTIPAGDPKVFAIKTTGTGVVDYNGNGSVSDASDQYYGVEPGVYTVREWPVAGWTEVGNTCVNISVAAGERKTCLITNRKN